MRIALEFFRLVLFVMRTGCSLGISFSGKRVTACIASRNSFLHEG